MAERAFPRAPVHGACTIAALLLVAALLAACCLQLAAGHLHDGYNHDPGVKQYASRGRRLQEEWKGGTRRLLETGSNWQASAQSGRIGRMHHACSGDHQLTQEHARETCAGCRGKLVRTERVWLHWLHMTRYSDAQSYASGPCSLSALALENLPSPSFFFTCSPVDDQGVSVLSPATRTLTCRLTWPATASWPTYRCQERITAMAPKVATPK